MIKKFVMMALCFATVSVFAANIPEFQSWNIKDPSQIDLLLKSNAEINKNNPIAFNKFQCIFNTMKELIGKNASNMSYAEFKKLVKDNCVKYNVDKRYAADAVTQFAYCVVDLRGFAMDVYNDPEYKSTVYCKLYLSRVVKDKISIDEFRTLAVDNIVNNNDNVAQVRFWVDAYSKRIKEIKDEDMLKDLKLIKKSIYSNISKSDVWKSIVVQVELMIKSIE